MSYSWSAWLYDNVCIVAVADTEDDAEATHIKIESACDQLVERKKQITKERKQARRKEGSEITVKYST